MEKDFQRLVYVTTDRAAYANFLDDAWVARVDETSSRKQKLSEIVLDLFMDWRAAAYTAALPVTMLDSVKAYHDGFVNSGEINTTFLRVAEMLMVKLSRDVPDVMVDPAIRRRIHEWLVEKAASFEEMRGRLQTEFPLEEAWAEDLKLPACQLGLWGSQRVSFVAIYNAYDNFLVRAVSIAKSPERCRSNRSEFKGQLEDAFGRSARETCWCSREMSIVKAARNSLSHAGGRLTEELRQQKHGFRVEQDRIQVTPDNIKALCALLQGCVDVIVEKARDMPAFD